MTFISQAFALTFTFDSDAFDFGDIDLLGEPKAAPAPSESALPRHTEAAIPILTMDELLAKSTATTGLLGGIATRVQQTLRGVQAVFVPTQNRSENHTSQNVSGSVVPQPSSYQRNRAKAQELSREIDRRLRTLDLQLAQIDPSHQPVMPAPSLRPAPTLTWGDDAVRCRHRILGAGTAATSALGYGTIAIGLPYAIGWVTDSFFASGAALLGAGYALAGALQRFPDNERDASRARMIRATMDEVGKLQAQLDQLLKEESIRQHAMERVVAVMAEHSQRIRELVDNLNALDAIRTARAESEQSAAQGAATEKDTTALAAHGVHHIVRSLGNVVTYALNHFKQAIDRVKTTVITLLESYSAWRAELAYQNGEGKVIIQALTAPAHDDQSLVASRGYLTAQANYQTAANRPCPLTLRDIRNQLHMGENIARSLTAGDTAAPGTVLCQGTALHVVAPSNLTTVRALTWYLDTAADMTGSAHDPAVPAVRRLDDGTLLIADPDSHLYDFLMQAPTAHTPRMITADQPAGPLTPGVVRLNDYYAGFPRGGHGVQFERKLDNESGASSIRMRILDAPAALGVQPDILPMLHDDHIAHVELAAKHSILRTPTVLATSDYQYVAAEDLRALQAELYDELARQIRLHEAGSQQLTRLEHWENPDLHPNRA